MGSKLAEKLNRAQYVRYDERSGLTLAWYGGQSMGINGYTSNGEEVTYWTMGGCKTDRATIEEVNASMQRKIDEQDFPY